MHQELALRIVQQERMNEFDEKKQFAREGVQKNKRVTYSGYKFMCREFDNCHPQQ